MALVGSDVFVGACGVHQIEPDTLRCHLGALLTALATSTEGVKADAEDAKALS